MPRLLPWNKPSVATTAPSSPPPATPVRVPLGELSSNRKRVAHGLDTLHPAKRAVVLPPPATTPCGWKYHSSSHLERRAYAKSVPPFEPPPQYFNTPPLPRAPTPALTTPAAPGPTVDSDGESDFDSLEVDEALLLQRRRELQAQLATKALKPPRRQRKFVDGQSGPPLSLT